MGLHRAGFEVVGVDIKPQPNYPFEFQIGDALEADLGEFDFVWASPPCQKHSLLKHRVAKDYECLIARTRDLLVTSGKPFIIENVPRAPLINPVMLCGSSFGLQVRRHRIFESNCHISGARCRHEIQPEPIDVSGTGGRQIAPRKKLTGGRGRKPNNLEEARLIMDMPWASRREISQAIPPAFSEFLGRQVIEKLKLDKGA